MADRSILVYPHSALRTVAKPIHNFNSDLLQIIMEMQRVLRESHGIGLAAPQIGVDLQLVILAPNAYREELVLLNPSITHQEGYQPSEEACLSLPGVMKKIRRADTITINALLCEGKRLSRTFQGVMSRILQHEVDHLHGKLIIDYPDIP